MLLTGAELYSTALKPDRVCSTPYSSRSRGSPEPDQPKSGFDGFQHRHRRSVRLVWASDPQSCRNHNILGCRRKATELYPPGEPPGPRPIDSQHRNNVIQRTSLCCVQIPCLIRSSMAYNVAISREKASTSVRTTLPAVSSVTSSVSASEFKIRSTTLLKLGILSKKRGGVRKLGRG